MIESSQSCSTNLRVLVGSIRYFFLGLTVESSVMGPGVAEKIPRRCVAYRRYILAGSRPGRRGTLVSAKVPKASCASARKSQRVPCTPCRLRGSRPGTFPVPGLDARDPSRARSGPASLSSLHCPVSLERPGLAVRGEPARRGGDSLDPRLLSDSPFGAWLGERRPKNTNT
jgi:hypothetical protein